MPTIRSFLGDEQSVWLIVNVVLQSTIVIMMTAAVSASWLKKSPARRHTLWFLTLVFIAIIPWQAAIYQTIGEPIFGSAPVVDHLMRFELTAASIPPPVSTDLSEGLASLGGNVAMHELSEPLLTFATAHGGNSDSVLMVEASLSNAPIGPSAFRIPFGLILAWVWSVGVAIGVLRVTHGIVRLARIVRTSTTCSDESVLGVAEEARKEVGLKSLPSMLIADKLSMPITVGTIIPRVVLPLNATGVSPHQLRQVLLHEFAHIRRRDAWVGILQRLLLITCWPQLLIRYASTELSRAREELCDNVVLKSTSSRDYIETLLAVAERCRPAHGVQCGLGLFAQKWNLESRIADLLSPHRDAGLRSSTTVRFAASCVVLALTLAGGCAASATAPGQRETESAAQSEPSDDSAAADETPPPTAHRIQNQDVPAIEQTTVTPSETLASCIPPAGQFIEITELKTIRKQYGAGSEDAIAEMIRSFFAPDYLASRFPFDLRECFSEPVHAVAVARYHHLVVNGFDELAIVLRLSQASSGAAFRAEFAKRRGPANETKNIAGVEIVVSGIAQEPATKPIWMFEIGDRFYIATPNIAAHILKMQDGESMANVPAYQDVQTRGATDKSKPHIRWFHESPSEFKPRGRRRRGKQYPLDRVEYDGGTIEFPIGVASVARHRTISRLEDSTINQIRNGLFLLNSQPANPEQWVPEDVAVYGTVHLDLRQAIPLLKELMDVMVDSDGFTDDVLESFRSDRNGPMIDLTQQLFPLLDRRFSFASGLEGTPDVWVAAVHVQDQMRAEKLLQQLFAADPNADPAERIDKDALLIRLRSEEIELPNVPAPPGAIVEADEADILEAVAVVDRQLLFASDSAVLRTLIRNRQQHPTLNANKSFRGLVEQLNRSSPLASGRVYAIGENVSTLPPFVPKLVAAFYEEPSYVYPALNLLSQQRSAIAVRTTKDGLQIDGVIVSGD